MITLEIPAPAACALSLDPIEDLQLRVARRADALARGLAGSREMARCIWLRAESELLAEAELEPQPHSAPG